MSDRQTNDAHYTTLYYSQLTSLAYFPTLLFCFVCLFLVAYCTRGSPLGKQLPPGLELRNKPQGMSHWLSFQPHTPQLKPKLNQSSYGNKRKKQALHSQTPEKGDGGYKAHLHYYSSSPHQIFHRHRRKKFKPRQSPCA